LPALFPGIAMTTGLLLVDLAVWAYLLGVVVPAAIR
jgi:hypothetical protein